MNKNDLSLVKDLIKGNPKAFEQIFYTYYTILVNFCKEYVIHDEIAKEIVQDTFMTVWERRTKLKPDTNISSFLFTVTRNNALNFLKHKIAERKFLEHQKSLYINYKLNYYALKDQSSEKITHRELLEKVRQSISKLPPKCKEIFILSRDEGLKYKEIADKLKISVKTVENQISEALRRIRSHIKEYIP